MASTRRTSRAGSSQKRGLSTSIQTRSNQIIAAIQSLATTRTHAEGGLRCPVCSKAIGPECPQFCPTCGWELSRRCEQATRRKYLCAFACIAAWGVGSISFLNRHLRYSPVLTFRALSHLTRHARHAEVVAQAVRPILQDLGGTPCTPGWPLECWPLNEQPSLFTEYSAAFLVDTFRRFEKRAWAAFRAARWKKHGKHYVVHCPWCGCRAMTAGYRHFGHTKTRFIKRWWCLNANQRERHNVRLKNMRKNHTEVRRTGGGRTLPGCGRYFSDLSETPFHRRQFLMNEWGMVIIGGARAVQVLHEMGMSAARCVEMITVLSTLAQSDPDLTEKLICKSRLALLMVMKRMPLRELEERRAWRAGRAEQAREDGHVKDQCARCQAINLESLLGRCSHRR